MIQLVQKSGLKTLLLEGKSLCRVNKTVLHMLRTLQDQGVYTLCGVPSLYAFCRSLTWEKVVFSLSKTVLAVSLLFLTLKGGKTSAIVLGFQGCDLMELKKGVRGGQEGVLAILSLASTVAFLLAPRAGLELGALALLVGVEFYRAKLYSAEGLLLEGGAHLLFASALSKQALSSLSLMLESL